MKSVKHVGWVGVLNKRPWREDLEAERQGHSRGSFVEGINYWTKNRRSHQNVPNFLRESVGLSANEFSLPRKPDAHSCTLVLVTTYPPSYSTTWTLRLSLLHGLHAFGRHLEAVWREARHLVLCIFSCGASHRLARMRSPRLWHRPSEDLGTPVWYD